MTDRAGDKTKKPKECTDEYRCSNMKETYSDMEMERYRCAVCGASYRLDYEDMK